MAVRMVPGRVRKALFTAHELEKIQANTGKGYELVRGELYDGAPPGFRHGEIQGRTYRKVAEWADHSHAGRRLELDDVIEADDVLPGFRCRVRKLFPEES